MVVENGSLIRVSWWRCKSRKTLKIMMEDSRLWRSRSVLVTVVATAAMLVRMMGGGLMLGFGSRLVMAQFHGGGTTYLTAALATLGN
ncbi:hypothetical protein VIGAN_02058000 [Vigna angularis var. angularis]|uniref:Uncharacterized protein n=1 Tax=Vigna angularis var. angularis TaxID=157739 RepID=A0A0S3RBS4_PHAAN|nr:hypothetical protein VIGAN_02058000 [Vigna angularis var. angularis]